MKYLIVKTIWDGYKHVPAKEFKVSYSKDKKVTTLPRMFLDMTYLKVEMKK